jgi:uncharacterized protein
LSGFSLPAFFITLQRKNTMLILRTSLIFMAVIFFLNACVTVEVTFPATTEKKVGPEEAADQVVNEVTTDSEGESLELDMSAPGIQTRMASMREKHKKLKPFYDNGAIGLSHDALIAMRDPSIIPLDARKQVNRWITQANDDRLTLYREIALANGHPKWEDEIRATFAQRWQAQASAGWWYQNEQGEWFRK